MVRGMARGRYCSPPVSAAVILQAQVGLTRWPQSAPTLILPLLIAPMCAESRQLPATCLSSGLVNNRKRSSWSSRERERQHSILLSCVPSMGQVPKGASFQFHLP